MLKPCEVYLRRVFIIFYNKEKSRCFCIGVFLEREK